MKSYVIVGRVEDGENQVFTVDDTSSKSAVSEFKKQIRSQNDVGRGTMVYVDAVIEIQGKYKVLSP